MFQKNPDYIKGFICGVRQAESFFVSDLKDPLDHFVRTHPFVIDKGSFSKVPLFKKIYTRFNSDISDFVMSRFPSVTRSVSVDFNKQLDVSSIHLNRDSTFSEMIFQDPYSFRLGHLHAWRFASDHFASKLESEGNYELSLFVRTFLTDDSPHGGVMKLHEIYVMRSIDISFSDPSLFHAYLSLNGRFHIHEYVQLYNLILRYKNSIGFSGPICDLKNDWVIRDGCFIYPSDFKTVILNNGSSKEDLNSFLSNFSNKKYSTLIVSCVDISYEDFKSRCIENNVHKYLVNNTPVNKDIINSFNPTLNSHIDKLSSLSHDSSLLYRGAFDFIMKSANPLLSDRVVLSDSTDITPYIIKKSDIIVPSPSNVVDINI